MLRVPVDRLEPGEQWLDERASRYVARVHRVAPGERVVLFDPARGVEAVTEVLEAGKRGVRCVVGVVAASHRRTLCPTVLLQGLGKGDKFDAIVRDATELGATRIVAVETSRAVVRLGERAGARADRWRRIAIEAARQSGRGDAPEILGPLGWTESLHALPADALRICLWEGASEPLAKHLATAAHRPVVFAVGPEGGLDADEVAEAERAGFAPVRLGPFILRTETVAAAVLGALLVQRQIADGCLEDAEAVTVD